MCKMEQSRYEEKKSEGWISSSSHWLACNVSMPVFSDPQSIVSHNCLLMTDLFQWKSFENNDTLAESKRRKDRIQTELLHMHKMLVLDPDLMQYPETDHIVLYRFVRSAVMNTRHLSVSVFFVIQYYSTTKT